MILINAVILVLLVIGHTILWIAFTNRTHADRWPEPVLHRLRRIHEFAIVLFPPILLWQVGLTGPALLRDGGSWGAVSPIWWGLFAFCILGWLRLFWVLAHKVRTRISPEELMTVSTRVDVHRELGARPLAPGPYHSLALLPGNEQFQLEFSYKHLHLPRLPAEWEGLRILHLSDLHFTGVVTEDYYRHCMEVVRRESFDLICLTGDIIDNMDCLPWVERVLGPLEAPLGRYFILGNHDWYQQPNQIRAAISTLGWTDLGSQCLSIQVKGVPMQIAGDETPWMGTHPTFSPGPEFRLLLSHSPDQIGWACRQKVDLMLSGHTHGGQIKVPVIGPVYSPSLYGCRYADGTFRENPTLMHVSRGLAGKHPLRYRCPPEITLLILHQQR
jgi:Predicted phosphohydrolases